MAVAYVSKFDSIIYIYAVHTYMYVHCRAMSVAETCIVYSHCAADLSFGYIHV